VTRTRRRREMELVLGVHMVCPDCEGTGKRTAMSGEGQRMRAAQLRQAKRDKVPAPPLVKEDCLTCGQVGYIERPKGT
jgi:hypothetical protein